MTSISVHHLSRWFHTPEAGTLEVLRDVEFEVVEGSFTAIVGPSGCGKSTLLNLLAGIDEPSSGEICVNGRPFFAGRAGPPVGFVFQQPRLLGWRTVAHNIRLPLERTALSAAEQRARVDAYLELTGLSAYARYHPHQLSGGMQQRVALARALAVEPDVLLMDEPFSGLDAITARRMCEELVRVWTQTGKTILFVTHDIGEAVFLAQRVLMITAKPARVFSDTAIELPYPRQFGDGRLFDLEKQVTQEFFSMEPALPV